MLDNRLTRFIEKHRKRQLAALLAFCSPEEKERILAEEKQRKNPGQLPVSAVAGHPEQREGSLCDVNPIGILRPHTNGASFAQNDKPKNNYPVNPVNPVKNYNTKEQ